MSKKNTTIETVETQITLRELMLKHENVSIAKLAEACDAPYAAVRAKSKQPVEGQAYDPNATNYEAMEAYLLKRSPELKLADLPWEELNTKSERTARVLKDSSIDFSVGKSYYLRYFKQVWTIVYATETHVCMVTTDSTQPKVMAKTTFVACGVKPADYKPAETVEEKEA